MPQPSGRDAAAQSVAQAELVNKLEWVMFFRVVLITILFGSALVLKVGGADPVLNPLRLDFIRLIVGTYLLTIVYAIALRRLKRGVQQFAWAQLVVDMLLGAVVVGLTGGSESLFLFMYLLTVLNAAFLLFRTGAAYASTIATALVIFQVAREATGWGMVEGPASDAELRDILLSGLANVSAIFFVGLLAGYLSEQLRSAGQRLRSASEGLAALKALNEHIITSIRSGLISYTLDHRIIFVNPAAEQITGRDTAAMLYGDITQLLPELLELEQQGGNARQEVTYPHPDGHRRLLGLSLSPLLDNHDTHKGWILIFQDLTPIKAMQDAMRRSEQLATVGRMAAGLAHEIRNPLAGMSSSIQMLERNTGVDPMSQRLLGILSQEAERLNKLLTDFLRYARPGAPEMAPLDLRVLITDVVEVFAQEQPALEVVISTDEALPLEADAHQIRQILWNLLRNAADVMPDGGRIDIIARRLPSEEGRSAEVGFQVVDRGPGMEPDVAAKVFDPFFTTKASGTGLGLALVQRMIEDHAGHIRVESAPGRGSTFIVRLPEHPPPPPEPADPAAVEARP
ncbi:MAG: PAS domain-containing protein [Myxococcales bacterium]|nr:PAS domain-containing protein [Myxococcales bacterium]